MLYVLTELFPVAVKQISIDLFSYVSELANCSLYSSDMYTIQLKIYINVIYLIIYDYTSNTDAANSLYYEIAAYS